MKITEDLYFYPLRKWYRALFLRGFSCNVFAIVQSRDSEGIPDDIWLIDIGTYAMFKFKQLKYFMRRDGLEFSKVSKVFITHGHPDHAAAFYKLLKNNEDLPEVYAHPSDFHLLTGGLEAFWREQFEVVGDLYSEFFPFKKNLLIKLSTYPIGKMPKTGDEWLTPIEDHHIIKGPKYDLEGIHTPGHTKGHMSYYCPGMKALFCGDLMDPSMDHKPPLNFPAVSYPDFVNSIKRVRDLPVEIFCAAHAKKVHFGNDYYKNFVDGVLDKLDYAKKRVIELLGSEKALKKGMRIKDFVGKFPKKTWPPQEHGPLAFAVLRFLQEKGQVIRKGNRFYLKDVDRD